MDWQKYLFFGFMGILASLTSLPVINLYRESIPKRAYYCDINEDGLKDIVVGNKFYKKVYLQQIDGSYISPEELRDLEDKNLEEKLKRTKVN